MKDLLSDLDRWHAEREEIALATLVAVRGSAPRRPGARLIATRSGKMAGSVSGGCVESDVFERALQVLAAGRPAMASYGITTEEGLQVGLGCGGAIDVLIEPFTTDAAWSVIRAAVEASRPAVLATALAPPALLGRRLAVAGGTGTGSIDPALDAAVVAEAGPLLAEGGSRQVALPFGGDTATVFLESFLPPPRLFVVGATHAATVLCRMAKTLGFRVVIVDPRAVYATRERFSEADEIVQSWPGEHLAAAGLDRHSYVVTLTHDPKFDLPTMACALRSEARYIGAMGSRVTSERRRKQLREQGFGDADLARIHAPIGLDIGGQTAEELALSILAEVVAVRHGRSGGSLLGRSTAIHGDG